MFRTRYTREQLLSLIPGALVHEPISSNFAYKMAISAPHGQTGLLIQRLQQHCRHFKAQALGAMAMAAKLDESISALKKELSELNDAEKALAQLQSMIVKKKKEQGDLNT